MGRLTIDEAMSFSMSVSISNTCPRSTTFCLTGSTAGGGLAVVTAAPAAGLAHMAA